LSALRQPRTALVNPLVKKLALRDDLSPDERRTLEGLPIRVREVAAGGDIVTEGTRLTESTLLLDGIAGRYKILGEGRRQITALHIAGDFIDLHSFLLKVLDHGVAALTPCTIALVPHETLKMLTETYPHLTRMFWLNTLLDAAINREWITSMGRRAALERTAHLFCELFKRLEAVGKTQDLSFRLPLTQAELGDALGLSLVHVNRVVQALRNDGLVTWEGRVLTILDWDRLCELAEFDSAYLYLWREPR
jgi:CRP-like cAMP-binding protein